MTLRRKRKRGRVKLPAAQYKLLCMEVHQRDGWKCKVPYCGARQNLHAHHIVFRSQQGDDASWNLITLCNNCHNAVHFTTSVRGQGLIIKPLTEGEPINADTGVRWDFVNGWTPRKTLR